MSPSSPEGHSNKMMDKDPDCFPAPLQPCGACLGASEHLCLQGCKSRVKGLEFI